MVARVRLKRIPRPGKRRRANPYPTSAQESTVPMVTIPA